MELNLRTYTFPLDYRNFLAQTVEVLVPDRPLTVNTSVLEMERWGTRISTPGTQVLTSDWVAGLRAVFDRLREQGYCRLPLTPEMESKAQSREAASFPELRAWLGGIAPVVSTFNRYFIAHAPWKIEHSPAAPCVYFGYESVVLAEKIRAFWRKSGTLNPGRGLDLGSGAGGLSIVLSDLATEIIGIEQSELAVRWSQANAQAQGLSHLSFFLGTLGTVSGDKLLAELIEGGGRFDFVVSNPPMILPERNATRSFRDGGRFGIELPLLFLESAQLALRPGGHCLMLATSPCVSGERGGSRFPFVEELKGPRFRSAWEVLAQDCLHSHYNQVYYRKNGLIDQSAKGGSITHVELLFLVLRKRGLPITYR